MLSKLSYTVAEFLRFTFDSLERLKTEVFSEKKKVGQFD
jgi:hypothetical protein